MSVEVQKMQSNRFKKFFVTIGVVLCLNLILFIVAYLAIQSLRPITNIRAINNYPKEFILQSISPPEYFLESPIEYPFAHIVPSSIKYFYVVIEEAYDLKRKKYDEIFFAEKRLSELIKWGNTLPIEQRADSKSFTDVLGHWDSQYIKNYNTWESSLSQYYKLIDAKIHTITQQEPNSNSNREAKLSLLRKRVFRHKRLLDSLIENVNDTIEKKYYLKALTHQLFDRLTLQIDGEVGQYFKNQQAFPLTQITEENEFGLYDISVSNIPYRDLINDKYRLRLRVQNRELYASSYVESSREFKFGSVHIMRSPHSSKENSIRITIPDSNRSYKLEAFKAYRNNTYISSQLSVPFRKRYIVSITSPVKHIFNLRIEYMNSSETFKKSADTSILFSKTFDSKSPATENLETIIQIPDQALQELNIIGLIQSDKPISSADLFNTVITFSPINEPVVILRKRDNSQSHRPNVTLQEINKFKYRLQLKGTTKTEEDYLLRVNRENWIVTTKSMKNTSTSEKDYFLENRKMKTFLLILMASNIAMLFSFLLSYRKALAKLPQNLFSFFRFLAARIIRNHFSLNRRIVGGVMSALLIAGFIWDVLILREYSDLIMLVMILLLFGLIRISKLRNKVIFLTCLFLLLSLPFFILTGKSYISEKLGIWLCALLSIGTVRSIISKDYLENDTPLRERDILLNVFARVDGLIVALGSIIRNKIKRVVGNTFILTPRTAQDHLRNLTRVVALLIISACVIIAVQKIYSYATWVQRVAQEKAAIKSLDPQIKVLEPASGYFATKIVIYGGNFGVQQTKSRIMTSYGEAQPDIWTGDKIILTVPLTWQTGDISIWLEKDTDWKGKKMQTKSSIHIFKLLPRQGNFTNEDDLYFTRLKTLQNETLLLNGYNPNSYGHR